VHLGESVLFYQKFLILESAVPVLRYFFAAAAGGDYVPLNGRSHLVFQNPAKTGKKYAPKCVEHFGAFED